MKWVLGALLCVAVLIRLPALVEPAGGDQGLYAYVGKAIASGGMPYRDAWDQKPPAVHYTYALMFAVWPDEAVVGASDLAVALLTAFVLFRLGRRLAPGTRAGELAALLFLVLGNPAFGRMGGIWVRGQCETFIALLVPAALLLLVPPGTGDRPETLRADRSRVGSVRPFLAGLLLGLAITYKYNAGVYLLAAVATVIGGAAPGRSGSSRRPSSAGPARLRLRALGLLLAGAAVPAALTVVAFWAGGALGDLWQATIVYNLRYSGETYASLAGALWYLLTFPVQHARVDGLWFVGGFGSVALLAAALAEPAMAVVPVWVAAACVAIAVNGARDLPQYFVQASPLLALAAGLGAAWAWQRLGGAGRLVVFTLIGIAVLRVAEFDKLSANLEYDLRHIAGRLPRPEYLARFGGQRPSDKFSALAVAELGRYLGENTSPGDRVFVFGFSGGAYVRADRLSASRFFWSRPVICGFTDTLPGYGAGGLLAELQAAGPRVVALQQHDWPAERSDSAGYFLGNPRLKGWLEAGYALHHETAMYQVWVRR